MLRIKKTLGVILAVLLMTTMPYGVFADSGNGNSLNHGNGKDKEHSFSEKWDQDDDLKYSKYFDESRMEDLKIIMRQLEMRLNLRERENYVDLYPELTDAEVALELAKLQAEYDQLSLNEKGLKQALNQIRQELRNVIRSGYSSHELEEYEALKLRLQEEFHGIKVLDVDSIVSKKINLKFEGMPPVIKDGRTLIPVAAIVKGLGAHVIWNADERSVLIWKDDNNNGVLDDTDTDIKIFIGSNVAIVDGVEVLIDAEAMIMNNRTIVPLRFIAETLHLKVYWHPEDGTIELDDSDTTLTVSGLGFSIVGTQILIPVGTTRAQLDAAITAAENGTYTIEDGLNQLLTIDNSLVLGTDVVVSLAENGYTEELYTVTFTTNSTLLNVTGLGFSVLEKVITMPIGTTRLQLDAAITPAVGSTYVFKNGVTTLVIDNTPVVESDTVLVTAQDGLTTSTYTLKYASTDTLMTISGNGFTILNDVITVPFGTTRNSLDLALTAPVLGSYNFVDALNVVLTINDDVILATDKVVSIAQDGTTKHVYSIVISLNTDAILTSTGDVVIDNTTIVVPAGITRNGLKNALIVSEGGTFSLEDGLNNVLAFDETVIVNTNVIVSLAEDGITELTYNIRFQSSDTLLTITGEGFSITDQVITVPSGTNRVQLDAAITAPLYGTYQLEDGSDHVLGLDITALVSTDVVVVTSEDKTEMVYSIIITE